MNIEEKNKISEGSYGIVYTLPGKLALKRNLAEKQSCGIGALRELNMLYLLRHHPHIISLESVIFNDVLNKVSPLEGDDKKDVRDDHIHFIFPKADQDLHEFVQDTKGYGYKKMMIDILLAVQYMHSCQIIHRDIKPSNILLFGDEVRVCDFGFAKPYTYQGDQTPGIATAPYRAPEIILGNHYDYKSDVWSLGCTFFEMISKKLFVDEEDETDVKMLKNILAVLPIRLTKQQFKKWVKPSGLKINNTNKSKPRYSLYQQLDLTKREIVKFNQECGDINTFCNLLGHMLQFNPDSRYSVIDCLNHSFFIDEQIYIHKSIKQMEPLITSASRITYPACKEREWVAKTALSLYDHQEEIGWCTTRMLFQGIDMFFRYLSVCYAEQSDTVHSEFETNLLFMSCMYTSLKYFLTVQYSVPFSDIVEDRFLTPECLKRVQEFEGGLVKNCFKYDIYHPTLYEAAGEDFISDEDVRNLLVIFVENPNMSGQFPVDVYKSYTRSEDKSREWLISFKL